LGGGRGLFAGIAIPTAVVRPVDIVRISVF
jgi:hypothetical protein